MKFNNWFLLNEAVVKLIAIDYILIDKENMEIAVDSLYKGRYSSDLRPIEVYRSGDKFVLSDGHHRLLQAILNGDDDIRAVILPEEITSRGTIELDSSERNYGLEDLLDNGYLVRRL